LSVEGLKASVDGEVIFRDLSFTLDKGDKVAIVGRDDRAATILFQILAGEVQPDAGTFKWGTTITPAFFPKENADFFNVDLNLVDWLRQYSVEKDESFIRGFLGRMLFSGEESLKKAHVLSGGEKVRCLLSRMMLQSGNVLILDEPTNHLDLESITALNNALRDFTGSLLFSSHDLQFVDTIANRIVEPAPGGLLDKRMTYEEYLSDESIREQRQKLYKKQLA
jgi:ATPase subunit of ABC transporter with duplicated ATPase domains